MTRPGRGDRDRPKGFTLVELMIVIVIISVLGVLAYPAIQTFSDRSRDLDAATFLVREVNRVRAQAQQRGRAYVMSFRSLNAAEPQGQFTIREANTNSCSAAVANNFAQTRVLASYGMGATVGVGIEEIGVTSSNQIGLTGWFSGQDTVADAQAANLDLCVRVDGAVMLVTAGVPQPIRSRVRIVVRRFEGALGTVGPPRVVEIPFAGAARLAMEGSGS